jgi:AAA+ ATPase superfamily predicted ATPase
MRDTPFRTSGRVSGEDFFGRTDAIRAVVRHLRAHNNIAIVGAPRTGKSSLINILFKNYKRADKEALTWFTDMREMTTLDDLVEEFYIGTGSQAKSHSLSALAKSLKEFDKHLVLFIDSAERFAESPFNEEALFAILASHLTSQHISLCLTMIQAPESVLINRVGFPLHTLFIRYDLLPFTGEECHELIEKKLRWTGIHFTDMEIAQLIKDSQGHPADLQQRAAELFKEKMAIEQSPKRKAY